MTELKENVTQLKEENGGGRSGRFIFNVSFAAYFIMILLLALLRVIIYFGAFDWAGEDGIDLVFTFIAQIVILAGMSLVVIACFFKKGFKGTLDYLQVKKPKPYIFLAFAIGFFGYFANMIINVITSLIYTGFGWHASTGGSLAGYPLWMFFVSVLFTAVLPGICEEIAHRGLVLRAVQKGGASDTKTILVTGLFFGLFHMYLGQTVFTFVMGCVMAFMTVKSKSIIPAVIMHFTNNFMSVCIDYFGLLDPVFNSMSETDIGYFGLFILFLLASAAIFIVLLVLFLKKARKAGDCPPKTAPVYQAPYAPYRAAGSPYAYGPPPSQPPQYVKPQSQAALGGIPVQPESQGGSAPAPAFQQNPYAAPQSFNPYVRPVNPYASQAAADPYASASVYAPVSSAQPVQSAPAPAGFKPSARDKVFYYGTMLLAGLITVISIINGL